MPKPRPLLPPRPHLEPPQVPSAAPRRKVIVWDLDDTIADFAETVCGRLPAIDGRKADWRDWVDYDTCCGVFATSYAGFIDALIRSQVLEACTPLPGVRDIIAGFHARGCEQVMITARGWHPTAVEITEDWLVRHGLRGFFSAVQIVDGTKVDAINAYGAIDTYVEDAVHHVAAALDRCHVGRVVMRSRPWNARHGITNPAVYRTPHLADILSHPPPAAPPPRGAIDN